jgi:DNA repair protein RecO
MGQTGGAAAHVLGHAAYFAELLDEWSPDGAPNERLYRLGVAVVGALGRGGSVDALARYFEYWLMRLEGVYPALDVCPRCEQASFGEGATLVMAERAYICGPCAGGGAKLSAEAMAFLRHTVRRTPTEAVNAPVGTGALREIEQAHARLIAMHLEKELQSARVVRELRPES